MMLKVFSDLNDSYEFLLKKVVHQINNSSTLFKLSWKGCNIKIVLEEYGSKEVKLKYLYQEKTKFQGEHDIIETPRIYSFRKIHTQKLSLTERLFHIN